MDQSRFDHLTRVLGGASTRRARLRAAIGGLLGIGIGVASAVGETDAKKKRKKKRAVHECTPNSAEKPCPTGLTCLVLDPGKPNAGRCMCVTDGGMTSPCGWTCCAPGATCSSTGIEATCRCADGHPECSGRCCDAGEFCSAGACAPCPSGKTSCGSACCQGFEICLNGRCCSPSGVMCRSHNDCCSDRCDFFGPIPECVGSYRAITPAVASAGAGRDAG